MVACLFTRFTVARASDVEIGLGKSGPAVFYGHSIGLPLVAGLGLERGLRLGVRAAF